MTATEVYEKYKHIPDELKKAKNWVCANPDKLPKNPYTGRNAQSNNPETWGTFDEAARAAETYDFKYLGFMFAAPYFGVDLDRCIGRSDFCDEFVETLRSYNEISCSGNGLHIICKGTLPEGRRRKGGHNDENGGVEMYSSGRFFMLTGDLYNSQYNDIRECTEAIKVLHAAHLETAEPTTVGAAEQVTTTVILDDDEIIDKARECRSGMMFQMLYDGRWEELGFPSQSEADLALCNHLAFWTARNREQIDRIFRSSRLMRDKWDAMRGHARYGDLTISKAIQSCKDVYDPAKYDDAAALAITFFQNGAIASGGQGSKSYDATDTGNAHRLTDKHGNVLHYSYNRKKWYVWTGKQWMLDERGAVKKLADEICENMKEEALAEDDPKQADKMLKFALKTASSAGKEAMLKEAQHIGSIPVSPDDWDTYDDYLNTPDGVINLENGELMPHDPALMMTKMSHAGYDPDGGRPERWLQFINEITDGDADLARYLQKCAGYSACGDGSEQCAFFLYGMGNNGKTTFVDAISDVLGSYAANAQPDTLMMSSRSGSAGNAANSDIARLKDVRMVTCEEPTEGVRLNEGLLKQLTGGGKITCRYLYGDEFEYTPTYKIWVTTNHKPTIRGTDVGIWRRIRLIPLTVNIPPEKVDKNLKYKLRDEYPQILAWIVEGYKMWKNEGIDAPEKVRTATDEYKSEMDIVGTFVEQCVEIDYESDCRIAAGELYQAFTSWCGDNGEKYVMTAKRFGMEVVKKLPEKKRGGSGPYYLHVKFSASAKQYAPQKQYSAADFK